jgi:hypothetical protein
MEHQLGYIIDYVKKQIAEARKRVDELREIIRLGELMGIDMTLHKVKLDELERRLQRYEEGYKRYEEWLRSKPK